MLAIRLRYLQRKSTLSKQACLSIATMVLQLELMGISCSQPSMQFSCSLNKPMSIKNESALLRFVPTYRTSVTSVNANSSESRHVLVYRCAKAYDPTLALEHSLPAESRPLSCLNTFSQQQTRPCAAILFNIRVSHCL